MSHEELVPLTDKEREIIQQLADQQGKPFDQMATELAQQGLATRVRKRTGKGPAKVYTMRKKN